MGSFDFADMPAFYKILFPEGLIKALSIQGSAFRARLAMSDSFGGASVKEVPMQYALPQARSRLASTAIAQRTTANAKLAQWTVKPGYDYATFQVGYADILRARDDQMAFGRLQQIAMTSTLASLNDSINRTLYRDGTGAIGTISALTTTTIANDTATLTNTADAYLFEVGMATQFFNTIGNNAVPNLLGGGVSHNILAINPESGTLQYDFDLTTVPISAGTTQILDLGDGQGYGSTVENGVIVGLSVYLPITAPVSGDNLWGQDRSFYTVKLAGHRANAQGKNLWEEVQRLVARIMRLKGKPDTCYMAPEQLQNMIIGRDALTENFREVVTVRGDDGEGGEMVQEIGFAGVRISTPNGNLDCFGDPFCPPDRVYVLQQNTWELQTMGEFPHMVTMGNVNGMLQETNSYAMQVRFFAAGQLICTAPAYNGVLQVTPVI